jgi:hypothetical protein
MNLGQSTPSVKRTLHIGNDDYRKHSKLSCHVNNVKDLAEKLESIDFKVTIGTNETRENIETMVETFSKDIGNGDLIFLYFIPSCFIYSESKNYPSTYITYAFFLCFSLTKWTINLNHTSLYSTPYVVYIILI